MKSRHGIFFKKEFGQNFLHEHWVTDAILNSVTIDCNTTILEIGCGDGFLTKALLMTEALKIIGYEIDKEWYGYLKNRTKNTKLALINQDIMTIEWSSLAHYQPLILLANLPYNITFPLLYKIQEFRHFFQELTVMVQEEVAQKICKTSGKDFGVVSLFFQYYFDWTLLDKIPPTSFEPSPNVESRLIHAKPKKNINSIPRETEFWEFLKLCFKQPRRTLANNLKNSCYEPTIEAQYKTYRAQEISINDFVTMWNNFIIKN